LRSSFLEIDLTANAARGEAASAPPPAVVRFVEMERMERHPEHFGIELGGAAVLPIGGFGAALLPLAQFDWALAPRFLLRASLAGLGTHPVVRTTLGSAQVSQQYGMLGVAYRFRPGKRVRPLIALSAGVLHTAVAGTPKGTINQGRDAAQWSFLVDGGLGASLRLRDRLYLSMAAHAQVAEPYPAVSFLDTIVSTSARPSLLLTLAIGAWL
jgi:hypothetical protein